MPFNNSAKNAALDALDEGASQITHTGIHTLTDPGTGTDANSGEATGGSPAYARLSTTWGAAASGSKTNTGGLTFDLPAGTYGFFTFWNAATGNTNNYKGWAPFRGNPASAVEGFGTVDAADVTANTITSNAHGLANADRVIVMNVFAESLPAGLTEGTIYFVVGSATDTFQVSLTQGGAAVDITGQGELYFVETIPEIYAGQGQLTVGVGALALTAVVI